MGADCVNSTTTREVSCDAEGVSEGARVCVAVLTGRRGVLFAEHGGAAGLVDWQQRHNLPRLSHRQLVRGRPGVG